MCCDSRKEQRNSPVTHQKNTENQVAYPEKTKGEEIIRWKKNPKANAFNYHHFKGEQNDSTWSLMVVEKDPGQGRGQTQGQFLIESENCTYCA